MPITPIYYCKKTFIEFLQKNNVSDNIVEKFKKFPEKLIRRNKEFNLYIVSTRYNTKTPHHNFELNYYSDELVEFLFIFKVFDDAEKSINFLFCELINNNYIAKQNK